jgi:hypothetical protein
VALGSAADRKLGQTICAPGGLEQVTLRDAGEYVQALPRSKDERPEWQIAAEILLAVGDQTQCEENNGKNAQAFHVRSLCGDRSDYLRDADSRWANVCNLLQAIPFAGHPNVKSYALFEHVIAFSVLGFLFLAFCSWLSVLGFLFLAFCSWLSVLGFLFFLAFPNRPPFVGFVITIGAVVLEYLQNFTTGIVVVSRSTTILSGFPSPIGGIIGYDHPQKITFAKMREQRRARHPSLSRRLQQGRESRAIITSLPWSRRHPLFRRS